MEPVDEIDENFESGLDPIVEVDENLEPDPDEVVAKELEPDPVEDMDENLEVENPVLILLEVAELDVRLPESMEALETAA